MTLFDYAKETHLTCSEVVVLVSQFIHHSKPSPCNSGKVATSVCLVAGYLESLVDMLLDLKPILTAAFHQSLREEKPCQSRCAGACKAKQAGSTACKSDVQVKQCSDPMLLAERSASLYIYSQRRHVCWQRHGISALHIQQLRSMHDAPAGRAFRDNC